MKLCQFIFIAVLVTLLFGGASQAMTVAPNRRTPEKGSTAYPYDGVGNLKSILYPQLSIFFGRRSLGLSSSMVNVGFDAIGQLTAWSAAESGGALRQNEQLAYGFDAAHNLHTRTNGAQAQTFTTDAANQLNTVARTGTLTLSGSTPAPAASITVNGQAAQIYGDFTCAATNLMLANGVNSFTNVGLNLYGVRTTNLLTVNLPLSVALLYDSNGNLTNDGTRSFAYDWENQLTNVYVPGQWRSDFVYDGLNRRRIERDYLWQNSAWAMTNEARLVYDGYELLQERDTNGKVLVTYTRGLDASGSLQGAGGIGGLLARTDTNGSTSYHADGAGNITALMDGEEIIAARYLYNPFGKLIAQWGPMAPVNAMRFSSMPYYSSPQIYGYWGRFYDPNLQRWLNQDPIGERGGLNLYGMVGNNPINYVDPLGLLDHYYSSGSFLQPSGPVPYLEGDSWYGQLGSSIYNTIPFAANALTKINPFTDVGTGEGAASGNGDYLGMAMAGALDLAGMMPGEGQATRCVSGRTKDLKNLQAGERSLLDRLSPDLGSPKANWKRNAGVLREEMNRGLPIRDASIGDTSGLFLNAERNLLESRGWTFNKNTGYWMPPTK